MQAAAKRGRGLAAGDSLSALTDDLLHLVLSFLPAPQVVRTSVLSKRWRDLWRSVPDIDINIWYFPYDSDHEVWWRKMEDFTTNLLMRHRAPRLNSFRLYMFSIKVDWFRDISRWIRRAVEYHPSELQVQLVGVCGYQYQLPYLGSSHLKRLHLSWLSLDRSFAQQLLYGLPVLEDLHLNQCHLKFDGIQSNTVRKLVMACCWIQDADIFVVRTPCLASMCLKFCSYSNTPVSLEAGNFLATVSISILPSRFSQKYEAMLIGSLCNVMSLELRGFDVMAILDKQFDKIPMFDNLRTLSLLFGCLSKRDVHKLQALGRFLQKSLNLEKLTLDYFLYSGSFKRLEQKENMSRLKGARPVVGSTEFPVLKKLRTLIMYGYDLCDDFQLLRHCLRHSPNLEKLIIDCYKLPEASTGGKGKNKLKEAYSQFQITPRFKCLKLKSTEIKYEDGNNVGELVNFLVGVSGGSSNNIIKLTMVEEDLTDVEDEVADLPG